MSEQAKPNLFQRLNEIRKGVDYIQKDKSVSTGASGSYKAVTHDMVTAMTRDLFVKHGVIVLPSLYMSKMSAPLQLDPAKPNRQWLYEATYDFKFINVDDPKEFEIVRIEAHANDNADKAPGKALSYAKKYAILKVLEIETGEDEESRVPQEADLEPHLIQIGGCQTLDELKAVFAESFRMLANDKEATKALIKAKDNKKSELSNVTS